MLYSQKTFLEQVRRSRFTSLSFDRGANLRHMFQALLEIGLSYWLHVGDSNAIIFAGKLPENYFHF